VSKALQKLKQMTLTSSYPFHRDSIFGLEVSKAKAMTEIRKSGGHGKVASMLFVLQLETHSVLY